MLMLNPFGVYLNGEYDRCAGVAQQVHESILGSPIGPAYLILVVVFEHIQLWWGAGIQALIPVFNMIWMVIEALRLYLSAPLGLFVGGVRSNYSTPNWLLQGLDATSHALRDLRCYLNGALVSFEELKNSVMQRAWSEQEKFTCPGFEYYEGIGSVSEPFCVQKDSANLFYAIFGRHFGTRLQPELTRGKPSGVYEEFLNFCDKDLDEHIKLIEPRLLQMELPDIDEWIENIVEPKKRTDYRDGRETVERDHYINATLELLMKTGEVHHEVPSLWIMEKMAQHKVDAGMNVAEAVAEIKQKYARCLFNPSRGLKAWPGWFNYVLIRATRCCAWFAHGLNCGELAEAVQDMVKVFDEPKGYGVDGKFFDSHQPEETIRRVDNKLIKALAPIIGKRFCVPRYITDEVIRVSTSPMLPFVAYHPGEGRKRPMVRGKVLGTTYSGHPLRTSYGNSHRQYLYVKFLLNKAGITKYRMLVLGDDVLFFIEAGQDHLLDAVRPLLFSQDIKPKFHGLGQCVTEFVKTDDRFSFLSKIGFLARDHTAVLTRKFGRWILGSNWTRSIKKGFGFGEYNHAVTNSLKASSANIGIFVEVIKERLRKLKHKFTDWVNIPEDLRWSHLSGSTEKDYSEYDLEIGIRTQFSVEYALNCSYEALRTAAYVCGSVGADGFIPKTTQQTRMSTNIKISSTGRKRGPKTTFKLRQRKRKTFIAGLKAAQRPRRQNPGQMQALIAAVRANRPKSSFPPLTRYMKQMLFPEKALDPRVADAYYTPTFTWREAFKFQLTANATGKLAICGNPWLNYNVLYSNNVSLNVNAIRATDAIGWSGATNTAHTIVGYDEVRPVCFAMTVRYVGATLTASGSMSMCCGAGLNDFYGASATNVVTACTNLPTDTLRGIMIHHGPEDVDMVTSFPACVYADNPKEYGKHSNITVICNNYPASAPFEVVVYGFLEATNGTATPENGRVVAVADYANPISEQQKLRNVVRRYPSLICQNLTTGSPFPPDLSASLGTFSALNTRPMAGPHGGDGASDELKSKQRPAIKVVPVPTDMVIKTDPLTHQLSSLADDDDESNWVDMKSDTYHGDTPEEVYQNMEKHRAFEEKKLAEQLTAEEQARRQARWKANLMKKAEEILTKMASDKQNQINTERRELRDDF